MPTATSKLRRPLIICGRLPWREQKTSCCKKSHRTPAKSIVRRLAKQEMLCFSMARIPRLATKLLHSARGAPRSVSRTWRWHFQQSPRVYKRLVLTQKPIKQGYRQPPAASKPGAEHTHLTVQYRERRVFLPAYHLRQLTVRKR